MESTRRWRTALLLAAIVGCGGSSSTGDAETTLPSTTRRPRCRSRRRSRSRSENERLGSSPRRTPSPASAAEGLMVALPSGFPERRCEAGEPAVRPAISGPAWRQCRAEIVTYLEVAPPGPEPVDALMARFDCMADQGFIDPFPSPDNDRRAVRAGTGVLQRDCSFERRAPVVRRLSSGTLTGRWRPHPSAPTSNS